tara:strand:- start:16249 stop:17313 length:1065 start_codon:yes stop_codon:yes gene_type:complete
MANGDTTPSRVGLKQGVSGDTNLFLKKFSGEILTTFEEKNIMKPLHTIRTISDGKSAQFPVTGVASAKYHTVGQNIADSDNSYLSDIAKSEKIISIDKVLLASSFLANIDDVMNHYDIRSVYANELGNALANRFDTAVIKTFIAAARSAANLTGGAAGDRLDVGQNVFLSDTSYSAGDDTDAAGDPTGAELITALFSSAQKLDENDVPSDGRFCVIRPEEYYKLITGGATSGINVANSALNTDVGGQGSVAQGIIPQIAGINIFKSNHVPSTNTISGDDDNAVNDPFGAGNGYNGDFTTTLGIVGHSAAVGTVKLLDLATESEYQIERQGTLFVAKYAMGHGILRPECAIELIK